MIPRLSEAIAKLNDLPEERQEDAAALLLDFLDHGATADDFTPEQWAKIDAALARADRGEFASDDEVAAMFKKFGR